MSLIELFKFGGGSPASTAAQDELPELYKLAIAESEFVEIDIVTIYAKILTDVIERVGGLTDEQQAMLFDNCVMSNSSDGLITLLADAMANKKELFLVYEKDVSVLREATSTEKAQIKADYEATAESSIGTYISFKNYSRTDMVKLYAALEFCTVAALNKTMNLSKAIQIRISDLRGSVGLNDAAEVRAQAVAMAKGLGAGKDILMDAKDIVQTVTPDLTAVKEAIAFLDTKRAFYLGLPAAYVTGEQTGGLGGTGEVDTKAVERGLKSYYFSIVKPVLEALFDGVTLTYKSQDFRQIGQALEAMKAFELVGEEYVSFENKKKILEGLLDIDPDDNETTERVDEPAAPAAAVVPPPTGNA